MPAPPRGTRRRNEPVADATEALLEQPVSSGIKLSPMQLKQHTTNNQQQRPVGERPNRQDG